MLSFIPQDVLDEIWDLIESVSEGFSYLLLINGVHMDNNFFDSNNFEEPHLPFRTSV